MTPPRGEYTSVYGSRPSQNQAGSDSDLWYKPRRQQRQRTSPGSLSGGPRAESAARSKKVTIDGFSVGARVTLMRSGEENIGLAVGLEVIIPGLEREHVDELATLAHELCPYSPATQGNMAVNVSVAED